MLNVKCSQKCGAIVLFLLLEFTIAVVFKILKCTWMTSL